MRPVEPFLTAHLFPALHRELMQLLESLSGDDWGKPTAAGSWRVRDVAAHLLDGDLRQISFRRDRLAPLSPDHPLQSYADLVRFLDELNAVWVKAFQRVSPQLLIELHERTGPEVARLFAQLDPHAPALFGVAWAGETSSANWFDTAREYTERWHHQQQIRDAVGAAALSGREWLYPVLNTFLRGLPHAYRAVEAPAGTLVAFDITGEAGGQWILRREGAEWRLYTGATVEVACRVRTDPDTAWRLLTKGLSGEDAAGRVEIEGTESLGTPFLRSLAIMG